MTVQSGGLGIIDFLALSVFWKPFVFLDSCSLSSIFETHYLHFHLSSHVSSVSGTLFCSVRTPMLLLGSSLYQVIYSQAQRIRIWHPRERQSYDCHSEVFSFLLILVLISCFHQPPYPKSKLRNLTPDGCRNAPSSESVSGNMDIQASWTQEQCPFQKVNFYYIRKINLKFKLYHS